MVAVPILFIMKKAIVLLSGGLDSATTLYIAKKDGFGCHCLIFDYGQRHLREIESAKRIAQRANCKCQIVKISLPWKGSSLLDEKIELCHSEATKWPKNLKDRSFGRPSGSLRMTGGAIPLTYVPARNIIFLSFALSYAEAIGASAIFIGANAIDFSGYPDCRPEFYKAFQRVIKTGTKAGATGRDIKIITPLINMAKAEIVRLGTRLKAPYQFTWSCYKGGKKPCGECDSCRFRAKGFKEAGIKDPLT